MKTAMMLAALLSLAIVEPAHAIDISGAWDTNQGPATFSKNADGSYAVAFSKAGGKASGTLKTENRDEVFTGAWVRDKFGDACPTEKDGSRHWGTFRVMFYKPDIFTGLWIFCGAVNEGAVWTGARPK